MVNQASWARMLAEGPMEGAEQSMHICDLCARLLGVSGAGISMVTPIGNRGVVCATDEAEPVRRPRRPGAPDDQRLAQALADIATIGILQQRSAQRSTLLAEHLQRALNSRVVIEQAKGVLAERNGMSMEAAFDSLRTYARVQNLKLTDLAVAIVHHDFNPSARKGPLPGT